MVARLRWICSFLEHSPGTHWLFSSQASRKRCNCLQTHRTPQPRSDCCVWQLSTNYSRLPVTMTAPPSSSQTVTMRSVSIGEACRSSACATIRLQCLEGDLHRQHAGGWVPCSDMAKLVRAGRAAASWCQLDSRSPGSFRNAVSCAPGTPCRLNRARNLNKHIRCFQARRQRSENDRGLPWGSLQPLHL